MGFGFFLRLFDILFTHVSRVLDSDTLLLVCALVLSGYVQDTICINVKGHFDLRYTTRGWSNAIEDKLSETLVVIRKLALTLENVDFYLRLVIGSSRECLRLAGWNGRIAFNQLRTHTTHRLDTEAEWCYVEQEHILDVTGEHTALDSSTNGNNFIRVHALHWILAKDCLHLLNDSRHAGHTTHENNLVDILCR